MEGVGVDHRTLEARQQTVVFCKLPEFASNVVGNHQQHAFCLCMMEKNAVKPIAADDVYVGLKHQIHALVNLLNQRINQDVGVHNDQRGQVEIVEKPAF